MPAERTNLLGLPLPKLQAFFVELGEKPFRAQQVMKWIHHAGVDRFDEMTNLGKALREKLEAVAEIRAPEIVSQQDSSDGTRKWAIRIAGGGLVETVLIPEGARAALYVFPPRLVAVWIVVFVPPASRAFSAT